MTRAPHRTLLRLVLSATSVASLGLAACTPYEEEPDAGDKFDATVEQPDANLPDAHVEIPDAHVPDSHVPDAHVPDAAGPRDAGRPDAWVAPLTPRQEARAYFEANIVPIMDLPGQGCFACHAGAQAALNQINWLSHVEAAGQPDTYESARTWRARSTLMTGDLLYNMYEPGQSLILLKGQHAQLSGPAFGTTGAHLTRFIRWVELEAAAARDEGSFDAGHAPDAAGPVSSSSSTMVVVSSSSSMPMVSSSSSTMMVESSSAPMPSSMMGGGSSSSSGAPPSSMDTPSSMGGGSSSSSGGMMGSSQMEMPDAGTPDAYVPPVPLPDAGYQPPVGDPYGGMFHHPIEPVLPPDQVLSLLASEGPPDYSLRVHACNKLSYVALGNLLRSRGVNLSSTTAGSAATIYNTKAEALGAADLGKGQPEATQLSTAGAAKLFDILLQASAEIVATLPNQADCMDPTNSGGAVNNQARLFDDTACGASMDGCCLESGFTCLLGMPVNQDHLAYCDMIVRSTLDQQGMSVDPTLGKQVAVAAMLSGSYVCE